ncbi:MAG: bifunctional [glutamine synthetase] adenylyltransferase/[glutamine synthetase]-adenylyl-L-tyrosine phosphorylase [bacterium]
MSGRPTSPSGALARRGFLDPEAAERTLARIPGNDEPLVEDLARCADPDRAVAHLAGLADALGGESLAAVLDDPADREALIGVLATSDALARHLVRHPGRARGLGRVPAHAPGRAPLREALLLAVGADPASSEPVASDESPQDALRRAYRDLLVEAVVRDVVHGAALDDMGAELADLADAALEAALAIARADLPADAAPCRLAVIAMGKCGGRELNYVSDVDVIFVAEAPDGVDEAEALRTATRLASGLMRACGEATAEGELWQVDAALRPEGKQGALVRTLASHLGYYERWARTWEFQALLKARPAAGDRALGDAYVAAVTPLVWSAADRDDFVTDVQAMRRRVEGHIPAKEADRQLKLGRGGLRDVEFAVQLLQLVHGRSDVMLRSPTTLVALEALATWGYVGREDGATLAAAYRFLRTLEHRIQLLGLRRTHVVPDDAESLRRIGRSLGFRGDPVDELMEEWRRHAREVRRIHEKLFYRPLLQSVARLDAGTARLTPEAARERLEALGYADPAGALRHLEALTAGVSRRAAIQRTLLPVLLGWFAEGPDPDAALLGFRRMSDALGSTPWYLRLLRDESVAAERMARLLSSSRYVADLLLRAPEAVAMLADDGELAPRSRASLEAEVEAAVLRHDEAASAIAAVRGLRRRELFRISAADVLGLLREDAVMAALSDVAEASVSGGLQVALREVAGGEPLPMRFCVIAMGRFGGAELGYSSDVDVMFAYDPVPGGDEQAAATAALAVANELRRLLMVASTDPPLEIDADLRPEGRQGPLVRSLASYRAYYERWSSPWEAQALLRARPVAGDAGLAAELIAVVDPLRWPVGGVSDEAVREMRRLKARMESERLPRGADPTLHTKMGRGGLADVEWVAQLLQLRHAHAVPGLRTTSTLQALRVACEAGLLEPSDEESLERAWLLATEVRNAIVLARGTASDSVPSSGRDLALVAHLMGVGATGDLLEHYRRATRRARGVVERVFYG